MAIKPERSQWSDAVLYAMQVEEYLDYLRRTRPREPGAGLLQQPDKPLGTLPCHTCSHPHIRLGPLGCTGCQFYRRVPINFDEVLKEITGASTEPPSATS